MMMYADGFNTTQVENFILHARIIVHGATLPGQSWWRKWSTTISPSIIGGAQGGATAHKLTLTTLRGCHPPTTTGTSRSRCSGSA